MNREIPIVADDYVEMDFGTGCVKMTPAHDPNDFEVGLRHNLEVIRVLDDNGSGQRQRRQVRGAGPVRVPVRRVVADLEAAWASWRRSRTTPTTSAPATAATTMVEPIISAQWFVKMEPLARGGHAGGQGRRGQICPRALLQDLSELDGERPRLVHLPSALVGPSDPRVVLRRLRQDDRAPGRIPMPASTAAARISPGIPMCWIPGSPPLCGPSPRWAGRTRPRIWITSIPPMCWSPAMTSSSSGWPG